eukprot:365441-Chlamydomonas_euryale.AAC.15
MLTLVFACSTRPRDRRGPLPVAAFKNMLAPAFLWLTVLRMIQRGWQVSPTEARCGPARLAGVARTSLLTLAYYSTCMPPRPMLPPFPFVRGCPVARAFLVEGDSSVVPTFSVAHAFSVARAFSVASTFSVAPTFSTIEIVRRPACIVPLFAPPCVCVCAPTPPAPWRRPGR